MKKIRRLIQKLKLRIDGSSRHSNILLKEHKAIYFSIPKAASRNLRQKFADILGLDGETPYSISFPYATESELESKYTNFFQFCFVRNPWDRLVAIYFGKFQRGIELNRPFYKAKLYHLIKLFKKDTSALYKYPVLIQDMSFEEFIEAVCQIPDEYLDKHLRSQYSFVPMSQGKLKLDYVGKIETLKADFDFVTERIGLDPIALRYRGDPKQLNHSQNNLDKSQKNLLKPFPYYYNESTWNLVRERFKKDIELFSYDETWQEALAKYQ